MPNYPSCRVNYAGPSSDGTETLPPVVYVALTDASAAPQFVAGSCFYVAAPAQSQILAVALAAINGGKTVNVNATAPNPNNSPYTAIQSMCLNQT